MAYIHMTREELSWLMVHDCIRLTVYDWILCERSIEVVRLFSRHRINAHYAYCTLCNSRCHALETGIDRILTSKFRFRMRTNNTVLPSNEDFRYREEGGFYGQVCAGTLP